MLQNLTPCQTTELFKKSNNHVDCVIISAMPEELNYFKEIFSSGLVDKTRIGEFEFHIYHYQNKKILVTPIGFGTTFAACAITFIYHHFNPGFILFSGTAGGISKDVKLNDVVITEKAFEAEIQDAFTLFKGTPFESCLKHPFNNKPCSSTYSADEELLSMALNTEFDDINIHKGTVVSSNTFPAPIELFEKIKAKNALCIDMETSAFYQIAWLLKIPALAIRGISNLLNHDGTDDNIDKSDVKGSATAAAKVVFKILNKVLLKNDPIEEISVETKNEIHSLITTFNLEAHPEGGYFNLNYKSTDQIHSTDKARYKAEARSAGSSIYYLLGGNDFSAWHSLSSDEIWHYYKGSAVKIQVIDQAGNLSTHILGDPLKTPDAAFQVIIKAGDWFAAENLDKTSYCLVGCTVSPGFEYTDFRLADRHELTNRYPQHSAVIERLTRNKFAEINLSGEYLRYRF